MGCCADSIDLAGMAWTAGRGHRLRVGRLGDQVGMCLAFFSGAVVAPVAGGAGQGVVAVQSDGMADNAALGVNGGREGLAAADQQECNTHQGQRQGDPVGVRQVVSGFG